ncbi:MAG: GGDEF domain-containing protein [Lachnospiraceae bacterium]|nr:GGDEF domain-containing protein [Lachnospiraceae bacterium]
MDFCKFDDSVRTSLERLESEQRAYASKITHCRAFLKLAKERNNPELIGIAYFYMADASYNVHDKKNINKFSDYLAYAIPYLKQVGNIEYLIRSYNLFGVAASIRGEFHASLDYFMTAVSIPGAEENFPGRIAPILYNIGVNHLYFNEFRSALKYIKYAQRVARRTPGGMRPNILIMSLTYMGLIYLEINDIKNAQKCRERLVDIFEKNDGYLKIYAGTGYYNFRILLAHKEGNITERNLQIDEFEGYVRSNNKSLMSTGALVDSCKYLMQIEVFEPIKDIISIIAPVIKKTDVAYLKVIYADMLVSYYKKIGNIGLYNKALEDYYKYTKERDEDSFRNNSIYLDIRKKMNTLELENIRLAHDAMTDALTELPNRAALNEFMDKTFETSYRKKVNFGILFIDVDYFKEYNDTYGHQGGDRILIAIADVIKKTGEEYGAFPARYGGDEFVLIFSDFSDADITKVAEAVKQRVIKLKVPNKAVKSGFVTVSQGFYNEVPIAGKGNMIWDYMHNADDALYKVKTHIKGGILNSNAKIKK